MRHNKYKAILAISGLALFSACANKLEPVVTNAEDIVFSASVAPTVTVAKSSASSRAAMAPIRLVSEDSSLEMYLVPEESSSWFDDAPATKGTMYQSSDAFNMNGTFGLYAFVNGALEKTNSKYQGTSGIWISSDALQWPGVGNTLDFFAVAPHLETVTMNATSKNITYTVPSDFAAQGDLMVAKATGVSGAFGNRVSLPFSHCLSAIKFRTAPSFSATVKSVTLTNLKPTASWNVSTGAITSAASGTATNYTCQLETPVSTPDTDILGADKAFLVIPQTTQSGSKIQVLLTYNGVDVTLSADISSTTWQQGYTYTYTLSASISNGLFYTLGDEEDSEIFAGLDLPQGQIIQGYADYPADPVFPGFSFVSWVDQNGNTWSNNGGKFNRTVSGLVFLHPTWVKTGTELTLMRGTASDASLKFSTALHNNMGTSTKVVFGNWNQYGSVVGGSFTSGTLVGDSKYDNIRLFNKNNVTYILAEGTKTIAMHANSESLFKETSAKIQEIDLRTVNSSTATKMAGMFHGCAALTRILIDSSWSTASVTDNGNNMFASCANLSGDWGTYVSTPNLQYARADGIDGGYLSTTTNKYYVLNKEAAHAWVKAALGAGAVHIHFGCFDDFKDGDGKVGNRTWAENVEAQGFGFSGMFFNTSVGHSGHSVPCFDTKGHHIADFFASTVDGWVLSEGKSIMVFTGDYSGFLQGTGYGTMQSIEFVNVDISRATNFPYTDKVVTR